MQTERISKEGCSDCHRPLVSLKSKNCQKSVSSLERRRQLKGLSSHSDKIMGSGRGEKGGV